MAHSRHQGPRSHKRKEHQQKKYNAVVEYRGLNRKTNFVKNQRNLIRNVRAYVKANNWEKPRSIPHNLISYIRNLAPVHQCKADIFQSMCVLGHVLSNEYREDLTEPNYAVRIVSEHNRVRNIIPDLLVQDSDIYITALVDREYDKHNQVTHREKEYHRIIQEKSALLSASIGQTKVDIIRHRAIDVAKAAITLQAAKPGLNHNKDKDFGTNRHIFAILGPHTGNYGDIFIVFNRELMLHPDSNFSTSAATTYGHSQNAYKHQPWLTDPGEDKKRIQCFHSNKMHCSVRDYEYAVAHALMASTGLKKKTMNVKLKEVQEWMRKKNPHALLEAHLPSCVSIDNIARVYMPKSIFESYSHQLQKSIRKFFGSSLIVTKHNVDQSNQASLGDLTDSNSRASYQKYVNDKLTKHFSRQKRKPRRHERGTVLTLSQTEFQGHARLPMTISETRSQYLKLWKKKKIDQSSQMTTYISWQAMFGDMMLTVSNEPIHLHTQVQAKLRCLICYIAPIPSSSTTYSQESYSYLTNDTPLKHKINTLQRKYKVGSNKFHRHCNFNEYNTYRLKIEQNTGRVTLSHADSNSRHNKEKLVCKFKKAELDLNKLIYVHVSANKHPVPIRNLMILFERAHRLHPSSDKRGRNSVTQQNGNRRHSAPPTNRVRDLHHSSRHWHRRNSSVHHPRSRTGSLPSNRGEHRSRFSSGSHRSRSKSTGRNSRRSSGEYKYRS